MWLFNQPPRQLLRERHRFDASEAWLEHLQRASIRLAPAAGRAASSVRMACSSPITTLAADALQKLSTKERNYLRDGFYARTPAQEIKCVDLELNVLESIEDVTARVNDAVPRDADPAKAFGRAAQGHRRD